MVSAEREAMMGWTEGVGVAAWVTKWRPIAAFAVSKADLRKADVAFDNNTTFGNDEQSCRGVRMLFVDLSLRAAGTRHY